MPAPTTPSISGSVALLSEAPQRTPKTADIAELLYLRVGFLPRDECDAIMRDISRAMCIGAVNGTLETSVGTIRTTERSVVYRPAPEIMAALNPKQPVGRKFIAVRHGQNRTNRRLLPRRP